MIELLRKAGVNVAYNDPFFPKVGRGVTTTETRLAARSTTSPNTRPS